MMRASLLEITYTELVTICQRALWTSLTYRGHYCLKAKHCLSMKGESRKMVEKRYIVQGEVLL